MRRFRSNSGDTSPDVKTYPQSQLDALGGFAIPHLGHSNTRTSWEWKIRWIIASIASEIMLVKRNPMLVVVRWRLDTELPET